MGVDVAAMVSVIELWDMGVEFAAVADIILFFMWQERLFLETQAERLEKTMRQLADQHRQKIALLESQFLQQKQQLLRGEKTLTPHCLHDAHGPLAYQSHQIKMVLVP